MDVEENFHTVIIGGGIAGVSLAYYLAELEGDGNGILVLEGDELASGATGGSLGGVRQQFSTPQAVEFGMRGLDFWRGFEERFEYPCPFHQEGYLLMTSEAETYSMLDKAAQVQREAGAVEVEMLSADGIANLLPWVGTDGLVGGCWTPHDGRVNPTDGVYGLARAARRLGVKFKLHTPVRSISAVGNSWRLETTEPIVTTRVVVAAGIKTPALLSPFGLEIPITAMKIHSGFTTPVLTGELFPMTIDMETGFCAEREQDGAVITVTSSNAPDSYGVDDMLMEFAELAEVRAPIFTEVGIHSTTTAYADATGGDGQPFIGEVEPGLWVLAGFDAHGTMMAPVVAEFTAKQMSGVADPAIDPSIYLPRREAGAGEWLRAAKRE